MTFVPKEVGEAIWALANEQKEARAKAMPDVRTALNTLTDAVHRLKELGWSEACYCPKDGSEFEVIEAGSSGIHVAHYSGEWPKGCWWIHSDGDLWPSRPILWRPIQGVRRPRGES